MQRNWQLTYDPCSDAYVLSDGEREAWFAVHKFVCDHPLAMSLRKNDPINGLAALISLGLKPFRLVGCDTFDGLEHQKAITYAA